LSKKNIQFNNKSKDGDNYLESVINATGVGIWDWKIQTGELIFNERCAEIIGYGVEDLHPIDFNTWVNKIHPDDLTTANNLRTKHFKDEFDFYHIELRLKHRCGYYVWVQIAGKLLERDINGNPQRMLGTHLDISKRKTVEDIMAVNNLLLCETQQIGKLGGWQLDLRTNNLFWTDETYRLHDTSPDEFNPTVDAGVGHFLPESQKIITKALDNAINYGVGYDLELETYTAKKRKIDIRTTCSVTLENGNPVCLTGIFQDISEQKSNQRKLEQSNEDLSKANSALKFSAHYDPLTGLPNRNLLTERIEHAVKKGTRNNNLVAIAFIDLDGFKAINDNHGHDVGDKFLKKIATQLKSVLRDDDTLSRFGGDEFVAVINNLPTQNQGDLIISRMLNAASTSLIIDNKLLKVTASIGTTFTPLDDASPEQLLRHADHAMYKAKQKGKNQNHTFDIKRDEEVKHHNEELKRIAQALNNEEFLLYYQPKIDLRTNELVGVEALIRWNHPERGILPPMMFLPEVEYDLLDIEIGKWVINTAFKQLEQWTSLGYDIPISINISPSHLQHPEFVNDLNKVIEKYPNFKAESIEFEILESSALKDIELVSNVMEACKQLGVMFSIDDFGTGYSSLTYLRRLPAKCLKIDQSFIRDMLTNKDDKAIVEGIIELAKIFDLKIIAEGVETPEHGNLLLSLGSFIAQGYGIAKPIPENNVLTWLTQWKKDPRLVDGSI